jgi:hypothetical protein
MLQVERHVAFQPNRALILMDTSKNLVISAMI